MARSQCINEDDIQALLDNELSQDERNRVINLISYDQNASNRYKELIKQKNLLKLWYFFEGD